MECSAFVIVVVMVCVCLWGVQPLDLMPTFQPSAGLRGPGQFTRMLIAGTCHSEQCLQPVILGTATVQ